MTDLGRRRFLKVIGFTCTATAFGCSRQSARRLIPYINPPEDLIPGKATWYATTCRECPAGCGLLVKNMDGRVRDQGGGQPALHPINAGKVCARGQASLQGLYNPDLSGPREERRPGVF
jgi:anaerobic selenocysteine-containing dehydrogenase